MTAEDYAAGWDAAQHVLSGRWKITTMQAATLARCTAECLDGLATQFEALALADEDHNDDSAAYKAGVSYGYRNAAEVIRRRFAL